MSVAQKLMRQVESYRDEMIAAQRALTAIPALGPANGGQGEHDKARLVEGWLRELGLEIQRVDAPDERVASGLRPNLVAVAKGGEGPAAWALSHLDVVPPGDLETWSGDPYTLRVEGDKIFGRGVMDNQAGMVSSIFGLKAALELGAPLPGPVGLILVSDEETGSSFGLEHVVNQRGDLFSPRDLIVVPDAGEPDASLIEVAEKSILWLKVEVFGKQVHGASPERGVNALFASARMMAAVREVRDQFPAVNELFVPPGTTCEPTRKDAGVQNINTVPGYDVFYIDARVLPGIELGQVQAAFGRRFADIAAQEGATVKLTPMQKLQAPEPTAPDAPVVKALQEAIFRVRGIKAKPGGIGGGTVAAFFREKGLPVAVWAAYPETAHMPDEWCLIPDMIQDAQVFALLFTGIPN